jgi:hypothetical protein
MSNTTPAPVRPLRDPRIDFLGSPLPEGYEQWCCDVCTAMCNFEAMQQCEKRFNPEAECGFDRDQPESNDGCFALIIKRQVDVRPRRIG